MKRLFRFTQVAAVAMMFAFGGTAGADTWTGGGDGTSFLDGDNWDTGVVPNGGTPEDPGPPIIPAVPATTNDINGPFTVDRSVDSVTDRVFVKGGAVLNITGGTHVDQRPGANIFNFVGDNGAGTVNQSGGTFSIGHGLRIGVGNTANELDGTYNLTGGDLVVFRGANSKFYSTNPGGRPSIEIGDTVGQGTFEISGGSLATRGPVNIAPTGVFSVVGSAATSIGIGSNGSLDGYWRQAGTLRTGLDSGGVTSLLIDAVDGSGGGLGDAEFDAGSILDPYDAGGANNAWTTVMEWEGSLIDNGLALSSTATTAGWEMQVLGNQLQVRNPNLPDPPISGPGDFDMDGDVDLADLDQYNGNIGQPATGALAALDLDEDGTVDAGDFAEHYSELVETSNGQTGTFAGDVNLDGTVNVLGDAFALVGNLNNAATSWSQGDLNGDGTVNVLGDAFLLVGNLGNTNNPASSPSASAVPEPGSLSLLGLVGVGMLARRRR